MEERKNRNVIDNVKNAFDKNDDGKLDIKDAALVAKTVGGAVKKGSKIAREGATEKARLLELRILKPIFPDSFDDSEFLIPKLIRITERDKKYAESEVCQGSIGYSSDA